MWDQAWGEPFFHTVVKLHRVSMDVIIKANQSFVSQQKNREAIRVFIRGSQEATVLRYSPIYNQV